MPCPYFLEARCNQCLIFKGLFVPSIFEEKSYCRSENHEACGVFREYHRSALKVSKEQYLTEIEAEQYSA